MRFNLVIGNPRVHIGSWFWFFYMAWEKSSCFYLVDLHFILSVGNGSHIDSTSLEWRKGNKKLCLILSEVRPAKLPKSSVLVARASQRQG